jgi:hypothetical protein
VDDPRHAAAKFACLGFMFICTSPRFGTLFGEKIVINKAGLLPFLIVLLGTQCVGAENHTQSDPIQITKNVFLLAQSAVPEGALVPQDKETDVLPLKPYLSSDIFELLMTRAKLLSLANPRFDRLGNDDQMVLASMIRVNVFMNSPWMLEGYRFKENQAGDNSQVFLSGWVTMDKGGLKGYETITYYFKRTSSGWKLFESEHYSKNPNTGRFTHFSLVWSLKMDISILKKMLGKL